MPYFLKFFFAYLNFVVLGSYISILNFNLFSFTFQTLDAEEGEIKLLEKGKGKRNGMVSHIMNTKD
jgi:hypothetical protein